MPRFSFKRTPLSVRLRGRLVAIAVAAAAAGCGTVMTSAPSGFLSSYEGLAATPGEPSATRRAPGPVDPSRVTLADVQWRATPGADISDGERLALANHLHAALRQQMASLPPVAHGRAIVLRAAITRVEPVSPALNTVSALLLFVPLDRGGAAVEIEAIDAQTGQQLAALSAGYFAPMAEMKARFSKLAPAELALKQAAVEFARLLQAG